MFDFLASLKKSSCHIFELFPFIIWVLMQFSHIYSGKLNWYPVKETQKRERERKVTNQNLTSNKAYSKNNNEHRK